MSSVATDYGVNCGYQICNGPPYFYDYSNYASGAIQPSTVHVTNTGLSRFFQRYLLQKAISCFRWTMPDTWAVDYALYCLYLWGFFAVINTDKFGVIPQGCTLKGYDIMYQPTHAVIANPLIRRTLEPRIGVQCSLIKLQPDYGGIWDLVSYYGDQMALAAQSLGVNLVNSKLAYMFFVDNNKASQSIRKAYDQIASGEPAVTVDKTLFADGTGEPKYRMEMVNAVEPAKLQAIQQIIKQIEIEFDCTVGIPNVSTTKRERELTGEIEANNINSRTLASQWLDCLKKSVDGVNKMFGLSIAVDWRYQTDEGNNDGAGAVSVGQDNSGRDAGARRTGKGDA